MSARGGVLVVAMGLALLGLPSQASAQQNVTIGESEYKLDPSDVNATAGQVVHLTIKNNGTIEHNFTVELEGAGIEKTLFDTNLKPGETRTADFTFSQPGKWEMYCPVDGHEDLGMKGDIDVAAAGAAPAPAAAPPAAPTAPATVAPAPPAAVPAPAPRVAGPAPAAAAPAAAPAQLPRTGDGRLPPVLASLVGLGLLGAGILARRR